MDKLNANTIDETLIWRCLYTGAHSRHSEYHIATIAYLDIVPQLTTVVLRDVNIEKHLCAFHTDKRSYKWQKLHVDPKLTMLFYSPTDKLQIKLYGKVEIHSNNSSCEEKWAKSRAMSKVCYQQAGIPGEIKKPGENNLLSLEQAYENFSVIELEVENIDVLFLQAGGNRRFYLNYKNKISWTEIYP
ncbi:MAG: pyridoxamine 5'-phosphate oxidase family protein [Pseudomonadota bacterium]